MWDTSEPNAKKTFEGHTDYVRGVCKINENTFASASSDMTLKLWNTSKTNAVMTFKGHTDGVNGVCKIKDNTFVSASDDNTLKLWHITEDPVKNLENCVDDLKKLKVNVSKVESMCINDYQAPKVYKAPEGDAKYTKIEWCRDMNNSWEDYDEEILSLIHI